MDAAKDEKEEDAKEEEVVRAAAAGCMVKRDLSVEDLFAPFNRLDMRPSSSQAGVDPNPAMPISLIAPTSAAQPFVAVGIGNESLGKDRSEEAGELGAHPTASVFCAAAGKSTMDSVQSYDLECGSVSKGDGTSKSFVSGIETGSHLSCNTTSDEDQLVFDERKQRRMLSNRESARRSRLRKQQHLDELRAHVNQLRAENSQMMSRFNLASQHYAQLTEENRVLRTEAMDLSHQLQRLHHTVMARYPELVPQGPVRAETGSLSVLSQPVAPTSLK